MLFINLITWETVSVLFSWINNYISFFFSFSKYVITLKLARSKYIFIFHISASFLFRSAYFLLFYLKCDELLFREFTSFFVTTTLNRSFMVHLFTALGLLYWNQDSRHPLYGLCESHFSFYRILCCFLQRRNDNTPKGKLIIYFISPEEWNYSARNIEFSLII